MKDSGQSFYFLRHGVTDHNQARLVMGQRDIPLNQRGREQARRAARLLVGIGITTIFTSPLGRARETAEIVGMRLGLPVQPVEALKERNWGILEGRGHWEKPWLMTPEGAETLEAFSDRVIGGLVGMDLLPPPVLVVGHSGICRVLRRYLEIDDGEGPVPHGIPLRYAPEDGTWQEVPLASPPRWPRRTAKP